MATKEADSYEVLVDGLTVHKQVGELIDPITNRVIGIQQGQGRVLYAGDVLREDEISPKVLDILNDEDHPQHESVSEKLKKVNKEAGLNSEARLGLPFAGYDELDEDGVIAAMANLPSAAIQRVKEHEASLDDPREAIVNYSIGYGESPTDRIKGKDRVVSNLDETDGEDKESSKITTREVDVEEGTVQPGEGITGTGDPAVPPGTAKASDGDGKKKATVRRGGRRRAKPKSKEESSDDDS